ncbi:MAG TPA: hypothetical protein VEC93_09045, partial [Anaerolineae bacterium]|nr:hypothetical protein [Anaerolineae bacterium]
PALLAAGLFALSPEGMVWGGRARMYALATMLVLLTVYWAYRGAVYPAPARYRWLALAGLLAALLSQFGVMMLVPPLIAGVLLIGWLSHLSSPLPILSQEVHQNDLSNTDWFFRKAILLEGFALAAIIIVAVWVKRLGRPLGFAALGEAGSGDYAAELLKTISYQTAFYFTWDETVKFLARQFGVPHHFWLTILTVVGVIIGLIFWFFSKRRRGHQPSEAYFQLFLWFVFGLVILEMVVLLEPFRRNPRYIVMYLPLFYLIAAYAIYNLRFTIYDLRFTIWLSNSHLQTGLALGLLMILTALGFNDLRVALLTPEPAYEQAFAHIQANWQSGDLLLTMNTSAAELYLGRVDGFTVQNEADQFLLNRAEQPVDRWVGAPWVGTMAAFNQAINSGERAWFVSDTIRQPVYFRGDWQA